MREQVTATATAISKMLQHYREKELAAQEASNVQAAELYDECLTLVRRHHDEALPVIEVMPDAALRRYANEVFEAHGYWAADSADAMVNDTSLPGGGGLESSRERFYHHARTIIRNSAV